MGISIDRLAAAASITERGYRLCRAGQRAAGSDTIGKLATALNRFRLGFGAEAGQLAPHAAFRVCLVLAAFYLNSDPKIALSTDPSRRANADPAWAKAAQVRRLAIWIANGQLGFGGADLARAAGLTKQAVSAAWRAIEDDDELSALRSQIEEVFQ